MTMFRMQSTSDGELRSYVAEGELLDIDPCSFGSIGVVSVANFARFYRHILVGKRFPHHAAIGFARGGKVLVEAVRLLGVDDVSAPLPATMMYDGENPFALFEEE